MVLTAAFAAAQVQPFGLQPLAAAGAGAAAGVLAALLEMRLRRATLRKLLGAGVGGALGLLTAVFVSWVVSLSLEEPAARPVQLAALVFLGYLGFVVGAAKGDLLNLSALSLFRTDARGKTGFKILDTSVIIDGRIADVAETGFLDGVLLIPQFVLWELQLIADSPDSTRRNRGRRGLDMLQRIQKMANIDVEIIEKDFPKLREVDSKLVELAKEVDGKIVTNDFNLNKLAQVQGVAVLNINELANALKPVVLPGELMEVFILKEGKEYNQGVAYLDDGTMVVVDNARDKISKTIEVSVTSVLQTTAGKMIFGRYDRNGAHSGQPTEGRARKSSGQTRAFAAPRAESGGK